jgi:hypothetical protein
LHVFPIDQKTPHIIPVFHLMSESSVKDKGQSCCTYMNMYDISQEWEATICRKKPCDVQHLEIK